MHTIKDVAIAGISAYVPSNKVCNLGLSEKYGETEVKKLIKSIGVETRHVANETQTTSDLCLASAIKLLKTLNWEPDSVGALIFVSQTPDYQLPATACVLQTKLGLNNNTIAYDVNLGCSGYTYGLFLASTLLNSGVNRVLLLVGDTISKIIRPNDRSTELLFGDAGTATALNRQPGKSLSFTLGTDGSGFEHIIAKDKKINDKSEKGMSSAFLEMDGGEVFKFTLESVPKMINNFLLELNLSSEDIDACIYHQANRFMLKHLSKKSKFSPEQVPLSIVDFGNTSSASIPLTLCSQIFSKRDKVLMAGFGVGLSWGCVYADISDTLLLNVNEV